MGHCNSVQVSPVSATNIEEMVRGALTATATTDKKTNVNITINACLNLMGSKNVVVFGDKPKSAVVAKDATMFDAAKAKDALAAIVKTKSDGLLAGRKRRAQSVSHLEDTWQ